MRSSDVTAGNTIYASDVNKLRDDAYASSWLLAHEQTSPDLTLKVENGTCYINNVRIDFAGGNSPSFTAPITNPRVDVLSINLSGTLVRTAGTESASPTAPIEPNNSVIIAYIYNRVGQTLIKDIDDTTNGYVLKDTRNFLQNNSKNFESIISEVDLIAGAPVGLSAGMSDRVSKAIYSGVESSNIESSGSGKEFKIDDILWLDDDRFVFLYISASNVVRIVAGSVNRSTMVITFGSSVTSTTGIGYNSAKLVKLDTDKFACLSVQNGLGTLYVHTYSISGTTITQQNATDTGIGSGSAEYITCAVQSGTNSAVVLVTSWLLTQRRFCNLTWSGYVPTVTDSVNGFGTTYYWNLGGKIAKVDTNKFVLVSNPTSNLRYMICFSVSGGTITTGTELTLPAPQTGVMENVSIVSHATNRAFVRTVYDDDIYYSVIGVSGTTLSILKTLEPTDSGGENASSAGNMIFRTSDNKIIEVFIKNVSPKNTRIMEITASDSVITRKNITGSVDISFYNEKIYLAYNSTNDYFIAMTRGATGLNARFFISGMSTTFLGFAQNTVSRGSYVNIRRDGDTNQTALVAGANYIVDDGGLAETAEVLGANVVTAKSITEVLR